MLPAQHNHVYVAIAECWSRRGVTGEGLKALFTAAGQGRRPCVHGCPRPLPSLLLVIYHEFPLPRISCEPVLRCLQTRSYVRDVLLEMPEPEVPVCCMLANGEASVPVSAQDGPACLAARVLLDSRNHQWA